jgi:hypothetical protein
MPFEGVDLYHPGQQAWHKVPNNPAVIQDFRDRGWYTPEESAAHAEEQAAARAKELKGKALDDALRDAGLPTSGTADEKRKALADHEAAQTPAAEGEQDTTEDNEGAQPNG